MSETATDSATPTESDRRLIRPADDSVVAGVCSGLARYFGLDPLVYRVAFAALVLLSRATSRRCCGSSSSRAATS
jgi:hypothetical protein